MIRAIIFDCFGVLTADSWHEFRLSLPANVQSQASELNQQFCRGVMLKQHFLEAVAELTGLGIEQVRQVIDNENDKNHQLLSYIAVLHKSYKIGLLSNVASNWIRERFLTPKEQALFSDMVFSYEVGLTKPNPHIYQLACQRLGVEPTETVFIDDIERYCQAAKEFDMQAVQYHNFRQFKADLSHVLDNPKP